VVAVTKFRAVDLDDANVDITVLVEPTQLNSLLYESTTVLKVSSGLPEYRRHDPSDPRNVKNAHPASAEQNWAHPFASGACVASMRKRLFACRACGVIL
jgi:hypothetical protein